MLDFFDEQVLASGMLEIYSIDADILAKGDFSIFEYIAENVLNNSPARVAIDTITLLEAISSTFEERVQRL
jgi:circadian clock protein KaiC